MLAAHPWAGLEYWFFKLNAGPVALLVDWIARRDVQARWLRVSIHTPDRHEVLFDRHLAALPGEGDALTTRHTRGELGEIAWELDIEPGLHWIAPDIFPARLTRMTDLALVSAPLAIFSGHVRAFGVTYPVHRARGMLSHYWGRRLPRDWWWISANQFDGVDVAVECTLLRSGLWGTQFTLPLAYLYLRQNGAERLIMAPLGLARLTGTPREFRIDVRLPGSGRITLAGAGRHFNDLGEGIQNTLIGDLDVLQNGRLLARARGTAAIEHRLSAAGVARE